MECKRTARHHSLCVILVTPFFIATNPWKHTFSFTIPDVNTICTGCDMSKSFVFYLCIAFGILFLVMLLVNVYLCCAVTGSTEICCFPSSKDKSYDKRDQRSKPEEFDPYARSWHGSQYGSRWVTDTSTADKNDRAAIRRTLCDFWAF